MKTKCQKCFAWNPIGPNSYLFTCKECRLEHRIRECVGCNKNIWLGGWEIGRMYNSHKCMDKDYPEESEEELNDFEKIEEYEEMEKAYYDNS